MSVKLRLSEILDELSEEELKKFQWHLVNGDDEKKISHHYLEGASRQKTIDKMFAKQAWLRKKEELKETAEEALQETTAEALQETVDEALQETTAEA
ncbi:hypothetical protein G0U57_021171, partial [Chelydra serpentina]